MKSFKTYITESTENAFERAKEIASYLDGRDKEKFLGAMTLFGTSLKAKAIYNSQFGETYSYDFSRNLERAYEKIFNPHREEIGKLFTQEEIWDLYSLQPVNINKTYRIYAKNPKTPPEIMKFMEAIKDVPAAIKELKTHIIKGRVPKPVDPNAFVKPMAPYEAQKMATKFLKEAVDSFKVEYEKSIHKQLTDQYNRVKDLTDPKDFKKLGENDKGFASLFFMRDGYRMDSPFKLKPDPEEKLERLIRDTVEDLIGHFIAKNTQKLGNIFAKKSEVSEHKILKTRIQNGMLENDMSFAFPDGSSFVITSQVIYKTSQTGKWFTQYPTRFTNVVMADGSRMAAPNEEKMIKEF